jgi:putative transposase
VRSGSTGETTSKGRKRQLAVDTLGLLWRVVVPAASIADCVGGWLLLEPCVGRFVRLVQVLVDSAYGRGDLWERVRDDLGCELAVVERAVEAKGFVVQHLRWIVEQSIACLGRDRRLAKDYEYVNSSSEARVLIAAIGRSLRRLAPNPAQRPGYTRTVASATPPTTQPLGAIVPCL